MPQDSNPADNSNAANPVSGSMFLYRKPELLAKEDHGHLGLTPVPGAFGFARGARAIPLVMSEFRTVQRFCPIVFSSAQKPQPLAVVGLEEGANLLVDDAGNWATPGYVPAYLRCYPFALAGAAENRFAVVFDRSAAAVSEEPEVPFFDGDEIAAPIRKRVEFCRSYEAEKQRTQELGSTLERLELLTPQTANQEVDGRQQTIARYFAVDQNRLQQLDPETLAEIFRDGTLAAILAHLFSLGTFGDLMNRRLAGAGAAAD